MLAVHPRVCGELVKRCADGRASNGSSPRVRGTVAVDLNISVEQRFIPACAGNWRSNEWYPMPNSVHPRVCGELVEPGRQPYRSRAAAWSMRSAPMMLFGQLWIVRLASVVQNVARIVCARASLRDDAKRHWQLGVLAYQLDESVFQIAPFAGTSLAPDYNDFSGIIPCPHGAAP